MKIIIINGYPESGKTTFINYLSKEFKDVVNISSIDYVKNFAQYKLNWNGEKTPKARKMLSDLKKLLEDWNHSPTNAIMEKLFDIQKDDYLCTNETIVFIDVREPEEIERLKNLFMGVFNSEVLTLFIDREIAENNSIRQINNSDKNVKDYKYDHIIVNNGNLEELYKKADYFHTYILG